MCACVQKGTYTSVLVEARGWHWVSSSINPYIFVGFFRHSLSLNLELIEFASEPQGPLPPPPVCSSALGYRHTLAYRHWTWVSGIPTQVPMLSWQDDRVITSALKFRTFKKHIVHKFLTRELQTSPRSSYPSLKKKTACYFFISSYFSRGKKTYPVLSVFGSYRMNFQKITAMSEKNNFLLLY